MPIARKSDRHPRDSIAMLTRTNAMTTNRTGARKWEMAAFAFMTGFTAHAHTSLSLGVLAGTLRACALLTETTLGGRELLQARPVTH